MPVRKFSRRSFLVAAGVGLPAATASRALAEALRSPGADGGFVGSVIKAQADRLVVVSSNGEEVEVLRRPGSVLSRGTSGPLNDFSAFAVGDRVAVEGGRAARGALLAERVASIFNAVEVTVEHVDPGRATALTDAGTFDIASLREGPGRVSRDAVGTGDRLRGLSWSDGSARPPQLVLATRS